MGDLDALARELVEAGMQWAPGMPVVITLRGKRERGRLCARDRLGASPFLWVSARGDEGPMLESYPTRDPLPDLADWSIVGPLFRELILKGGDTYWALQCYLGRWALKSSDVWYDTPGEAVGRALLAVLRAERGTP